MSACMGSQRTAVQHTCCPVHDFVRVQRVLHSMDRRGPTVARSYQTELRQKSREPPVIYLAVRQWACHIQ